MHDSIGSIKSVRFVDLVEAGEDSINQNLGTGRNWKATMGEESSPITTKKWNSPISPPTKPKRQRSVVLDDADEFEINNIGDISPPRIPRRRASIEIDFVSLMADDYMHSTLKQQPPKSPESPPLYARQDLGDRQADQDSTPLARTSTLRARAA